MDQLIANITHWYDLRTAFVRETARLEALKEGRKQKLYEHRAAHQAQVEYESSVGCFFQKLRGNTEKLERLQQEARAAKAALETAEADWKRQEETVKDLKTRCDALPSPEELVSAAPENPEIRQIAAKRELALCVEQLLPQLEKNGAALEEYRQLLRGNRMGEITDLETHHEIGTNHIRHAELCHALLTRMEPAAKLLELSLEIPAYFQSPAAFIESAAARHNRLDRVNTAIAQVEHTAAAIRSFQ